MMVSSPAMTSGSMSTVSGNWIVTPAFIRALRFHSRKMRSTSARSMRVLQPRTSRGSGDDLREHRFSFGGQDGDGVGEVHLAVLVVRLYLGEGGPEFFEREAVDARVDLVELALVVGELRFLDDGTDIRFRLPDDAAVAGRIADDGGQNGRGGVAVAMGGDQRAQGFGADERSVAWQDHNKLGPAQGAARHLHGVSGSVLRVLQDAFGIPGFDDSHDLFGLMPYDDNRLFRSEWGASAQHVLDQRAASGAVQHFRKTRLEPRTFSGGQDDDGKIVCGHGFNFILREQQGFRNAGIAGAIRKA